MYLKCKHCKLQPQTLAKTNFFCSAWYDCSPWICHPWSPTFQMDVLLQSFNHPRQIQQVHFIWDIRLLCRIDQWYNMFKTHVCKWAWSAFSFWSPPFYDRAFNFLSDIHGLVGKNIPVKISQGPRLMKTFVLYKVVFLLTLVSTPLKFSCILLPWDTNRALKLSMGNVGL